MTKIIDLCQEFYTLNTGCIPESKEKLNHYIIKLKEQVTDDYGLIELVNSIQPTTITEELFKLEIAIAVGNISFALASLKRGNLLFINRILRCSKFLQSAFRQISAEQFVVEIMPCLSYSTKIKLLNKLAIHLDDEHLLEKYYYGLKMEYPNFLIYVLPGCSIEFIRQTINEPNYTVSKQLLYSIIKNKTTLLTNDLETFQETYSIFSSFPKALKQIANNNVELFWFLEEKFRFDVKLGVLTTNKVLRNNLEKIRLGEDLLKILNWKMFHKLLKKNNMLAEFVSNCLPEERRNVFEENDMEILTFIQATERKENVWKVIRKVYEEKYFVDFFEDLLTQRVCEDIIKIILNCEIDKDKISNYISEYPHRLFNFQTPNIVIPILKERLSTTDDAAIINDMFENCALYRDNQSFQEVLEFIFYRFRYDIKVFGALFDYFRDWYYFKHFTPNMWAVIDAVFDLHNHYQCLVQYHLPFYFNHLVETGKSTENYFQALIFAMHATQIHENPFANREYEDIALGAFGNILDKVCQNNLYCYMCMKYTHWVLDHNKRCPNNTILLTKYPNVINSFVSCLFKEATNGLYSCLKQFEFKHFDIAFWKNIRVRIREDILIWYKRYHPESLIQNKQIIFTFSNYKVTAFLKNLYHYPQQNIIDVYKQYARSVLQQLDYDRTSFAAIFLSIFSQDEFYNLAVTMKPSPDGRMPYGTTFDKVTLQRAIANAIKNIDSQKNKLILIKQYCIGYYVKYCFGTFMNVCARAPEFAILLFLQEIDDNTVFKYLRGAKKAFLCKSVADETIVSKQNETTKIKNLSSLLNNMPLEQALHYLRDELADTKCNKLLNQLSTITDAEIEQFDIEVLKFFIEQTLFKENTEEFYCRCIFVSSDEKKLELLDYCMDLFTNYVEKNRTKIGVDHAFHQTINFFIETICNKSLKSKENAAVMIELLVRYPSIIDPEDSITTFLRLELTVLYFESDFEFVEMGRRCNASLSRYVEKYGGSVINVFYNSLTRFLSLSSSNYNDTLIFTSGLIEEFNADAAVLALHILPLYTWYDNSSSDDDDDDQHPNLHDLYKTLKQYDEPVVKFFLYLQTYYDDGF